jgi:hypothetical protein
MVSLSIDEELTRYAYLPVISEIAPASLQIDGSEGSGGGDGGEGKAGELEEHGA